MPERASIACPHFGEVASLVLNLGQTSDNVNNKFRGKPGINPKQSRKTQKKPANNQRKRGTISRVSRVDYLGSRAVDICIARDDSRTARVVYLSLMDKTRQ